MKIMKKLSYSVATENDIPFIMETYNKNIEALHGIHRDYDTWKNFLLNTNVTYYIVDKNISVAWFRLDLIDDTLWLGMLQVDPDFHRQGIGRYILTVVEDIAKMNNVKKIGVHTTDDNMAAQSLYKSAGYYVVEYGDCTTADGIKRMGYTFIKGI